jgi:two-component system, NarL family, sensor kinase
MSIPAHYEDVDTVSKRRGPQLAGWGLVALAVIEVVVAIAGPISEHVSFAGLVSSYGLTNLAIGIGFIVPGAVLALSRRRNPIGWIMLVGGLALLTTGATDPIVHIGAAHGWPVPVLRAIGSVEVSSWPWGIGVALPLTLLLFPTGTLPSRRWRPALWFSGAVGVLFVASQGLTNGTDVLPNMTLRTYIGLPFYDALNPLWVAANILPTVSLAIVVTSLFLRYRRGDEAQRRQLLWLAYATIIAILLNLQRFTLGNGPILLLLAIPLIPIAIAIAIVRYQLLDIRLIFARTVAYVLLSAGVVGVFAAGVALLDRIVTGYGAPLLVTLAIALVFNTVRVRLQRAVDRLLYGSRADPVGTVSRVRARLAADDLGGVLDGARESLRLPFMALRHDGREVAASGTPAETLHVVPLSFRGTAVGELVVGIRSGDGRLGSADIAVLDLLAAPLASALYASGLAEALQISRERIVGAREEERRRLHRDLHDGLGPTLTGAALKADAASNVLADDPVEARRLLVALRADIGEAISDVRRVVYGLRPPALDEIGLTGALRRHCATLPMQVALDAPDPMPALPAAVEVAAFRIVTEALTNAAKHAEARTVQVELRVDDALRLTIVDDGPDPRPWRPGVGLTSMRERAAELGGTYHAGPTKRGGLVTAELPLGLPA